ncbi:Protein of unknown function [Limimonas halophila]|uniref:DUF1192 domain-containing protein n=1 Tax=Limimonas halophila TaxID=1082479 RepID=A0A1G7KUR4_9PROT|nr:DUF1192 family protein [Limimonas halophila]SDF40945.1 Protein of unknown function [Limimonas halophila]
MEDDPLDPRQRLTETKPLDTFSIEELQAYQRALAEEQERVKAMLDTKQAEIEGAHKLFNL